jgi:tetratricopeptide (TPR) repeat protein
MNDPTYIRNLKHPYDGVCVVLEERGDRLKVYTERGEYAEIPREHTASAGVRECITPPGEAKLTRALQDYRRRQSMKEYTEAMRCADAAEQLGEWDVATDCYAKALAVDTESTEARTQLAECLRRSGRHEDALAEYRRLIAGGSATALTYLRQAMSLRALDRLHEAIESAQQALALDDRLAYACELLAELHAKLAEHYKQQRLNIVNPDGRLTAATEAGQISLFE